MILNLRATIYPEKNSSVENICALVPNIQRNNLTWYCIFIPFGILLLWLIYQTIFMSLISTVMKTNRNTSPTVSSLPSQKEFLWSQIYKLPRWLPIIWYICWWWFILLIVQKCIDIHRYMCIFSPGFWMNLSLKYQVTLIQFSGWIVLESIYATHATLRKC